MPNLNLYEVNHVYMVASPRPAPMPVAWPSLFRVLQDSERRAASTTSLWIFGTVYNVFDPDAVKAVYSRSSGVVAIEDETYVRSGQPES